MTTLHAQLAGLIAERDNAENTAIFDDRDAKIGLFMEVHEAEILAALQPPKDWVMVPVEPTEEMCERGDATILHDIELNGLHTSALGVWRSMLSAAPPKDAAKEGRG